MIFQIKERKEWTKISVFIVIKVIHFNSLSYIFNNRSRAISEIAEKNKIKITWVFNIENNIFQDFSLFDFSSHKLDQWHRFTIISLFLPDYECYEENSVYGYEYDPTTGNCTCKAGWFGNKCQGKLKLTT